MLYPAELRAPGRAIAAAMRGQARLAGWCWLGCWRFGRVGAGAAESASGGPGCAARPASCGWPTGVGSLAGIRPTRADGADDPRRARAGRPARLDAGRLRQAVAARPARPAAGAAARRGRRLAAGRAGARGAWRSWRRRRTCRSRCWRSCLGWSGRRGRHGLGHLGRTAAAGPGRRSGSPRAWRVRPGAGHGARRSRGAGLHLSRFRRGLAARLHRPRSTARQAARLREGRARRRGACGADGSWCAGWLFEAGPMIELTHPLQIEMVE